MKWYWAGLIPVVMTLAACRPSRPEPTDTANASGPGSPGDSGLAAAVALPSYNLGDVDVATVPSVHLSERSQSPSIQYQEMTTLRGDTAIANATVKSPVPSELWIKAMLESPKGYRETDTVLVRLALTIDTQKDPIVTKNYVLSGKMLNHHPENIELDLMPFLKPLPASVLVKAQLKIVWFPDTDPAAIVPETVDESKGQTLEKLSNPLRINFE